MQGGALPAYSRRYRPMKTEGQAVPHMSRLGWKARAPTVAKLASLERARAQGTEQFQSVWLVEVPPRFSAMRLLDTYCLLRR